MKVLTRTHHMSSLKIDASSPTGIIDVSNYPQVEDLIAIADMLITDYSSIAYDFQLTGKPVIRHIVDSAAYESERGVYGDIDAVGTTCTGGFKEVADLVLNESSNLRAVSYPDLRESKSRLLEILQAMLEDSSDHSSNSHTESTDPTEEGRENE